ncbi:MFS transporter [Candidatus Bathyarchaeota archaeon]|nr:MFS transporter [Candidatus Bathyarchaeota archaeon]
MWRLGAFFHEMGFGLLSIFLPLYIVSPTVGGSVLDVGVMSAVALLACIPFSFLWGYLSDQTRRYKRYILLSYLSSAVLLCVFAFTTSVFLLFALYVALSAFHVADEAPKNILIAELYSSEEWEKGFAFYKGFAESGWLIGLLAGFILSVMNVGSTLTFMFCSFLNLAAFLLSLVLVADPMFIFERKLVRMEAAVDFASRGIALASNLLDGFTLQERLKKENVLAFSAGLTFFSLATSMLFTPMPIFISSITRGAQLPESLVFAVYVLSSLGAILGYLLTGKRSYKETAKSSIDRIVFLRCFLTFLFILTLYLTVHQVTIAALLLFFMSAAYAVFLVHTLSLSMKIIPAGKAGLFNVLIGIGGACGSFVGPFLAEFSFFYVFAAAGTVFLLSWISFKAFA